MLTNLTFSLGERGAIAIGPLLAERSVGGWSSAASLARSVSTRTSASACSVSRRLWRASSSAIVAASAARSGDGTRASSDLVNANVLELRVNGARAQATNLADAGIYKPLLAGSNLLVGGLPEGQNSVNGKIATLLVALRPTDAEVLLIEAYLRERYF